MICQVFIMLCACTHTWTFLCVGFRGRRKDTTCGTSSAGRKMRQYRYDIMTSIQHNRIEPSLSSLKFVLLQRITITTSSTMVHNHASCCWFRLALLATAAAVGWKNTASAWCPPLVRVVVLHRCTLSVPRRRQEALHG